MGKNEIVKSGKKHDLAANEEFMVKNMQSLEMKKKIENQILTGETQFMKTLKVFIDKDKE